MSSGIAKIQSVLAAGGKNDVQVNRGRALVLVLERRIGELSGNGDDAMQQEAASSEPPPALPPPPPAHGGDNMVDDEGDEAMVLLAFANAVDKRGCDNLALDTVVSHQRGSLAE